MIQGDQNTGVGDRDECFLELNSHAELNSYALEELVRSRVQWYFRIEHGIEHARTQAVGTTKRCSMFPPTFFLSG